MSRFFRPERAEAMRRYMQDFAAGFGITDMGSPDRIPNTRRSLAIAELARERGRLEAFRDAVMNAHWRDGRNIEADDVLGDVAVSVGLDRAEALSAADSPDYLARIDAVREEAAEMGVTGIPTFIIGGVHVVGCQPYERLAEVAIGAGASRRTAP